MVCYGSFHMVCRQCPNFGNCIMERRIFLQSALFAASISGASKSNALPIAVSSQTFHSDSVFTVMLHSHIASEVSTITTSGYAVWGDGGAASYARVDAEPPFPPPFKTRSLDRYTANGDHDSADGGWWQIADKEINVRMAGAGSGSDDTSAFSATAKAVFALDNVLTPWNTLPHPKVGQVRIPAGRYKLTELVDTGGQEITWIADQAAYIDGIEFLNGALIRDMRRITLGYPIGTLDQACGLVVSVGGNYGDKPAPVLQFSNIQELANYGQRDAVAFAAAAYSAPAIVNVSVASYTRSTASLASLTNEQVKRLRSGMIIYTKHVNRCTGILLNWNEDGSVLTVAEWREKDGSEPIIPSSGVGLTIGFDKIWALNGVANLEQAGLATQAIGQELSIRNLKGHAPSTNIDDPVNRVWGYLAATNASGTLGSYQCQTGFIARGDWFRGFTSHDQQVGFYHRTTTSKIGFMYHGIGDALVVENAAAGFITFRANYAGDIFLGAKESATNIGRSITFYTSGNKNSFDTRIRATGGNASPGGGTLTYDARDNVFLGNVRPSADNVGSIGSASFRWAEVFAVNDAINTSDETQKSEFRQFTDTERQALLACLQHIGLFQWLASITTKGEVARLHSGVPAQKCVNEFELRGLNPWRYAWFCRDRKLVVKKTVVKEERPIMEEFFVAELEVYVDGDVARRRRVIKKELRPKIKKLPLLNESGAQIFDSSPDGTTSPIFHEVQATEMVETIIEQQEETDDWTYSIRYTEFLTALLSALFLPPPMGSSIGFPSTASY